MTKIPNTKANRETAESVRVTAAKAGVCLIVEAGKRGIKLTDCGMEIGG